MTPHATRTGTSVGSYDTGVNLRRSNSWSHSGAGQSGAVDRGNIRFLRDRARSRLLQSSNLPACAIHARKCACESVLRFAGAVRLFAKRADRFRIQTLDAHDPATVAAGNHRVTVGTHQAIVRGQADHAACDLQTQAGSDQLQAIGLARRGPDHHVADLVRVPAVQGREVEPWHVALHVFAVVD